MERGHALLGAGGREPVVGFAQSVLLEQRVDVVVHEPAEPGHVEREDECERDCDHEAHPGPHQQCAHFSRLQRSAPACGLKRPRQSHGPTKRKANRIGEHVARNAQKKANHPIQSGVDLPVSTHCALDQNIHVIAMGKPDIAMRNSVPTMGPPKSSLRLTGVFSSVSQNTCAPSSRRPTNTYRVNSQQIPPLPKPEIILEMTARVISTASVHLIVVKCV